MFQLKQRGGGIPPPVSLLFRPPCNHVSSPPIVSRVRWVLIMSRAQSRRTRVSALRFLFDCTPSIQTSTHLVTATLQTVSLTPSFRSFGFAHTHWAKQTRVQRVNRAKMNESKNVFVPSIPLFRLHYYEYASCPQHTRPADTWPSGWVAMVFIGYSTRNGGA